MNRPAPLRWLRHQPWLAWPLLLAAAGFAVALLVPTDALASWLRHPLRSPTGESPPAGASLVRAMLVVAAAALVVIPLLLARMVPATGARAHDARLGRATGLALLALVLIGLLVRFTRLGEGLWYDEIAAWREFGMYGPGPIVGNLFDPANHVLHTLLSWLSMSTLPGEALALRVPALAFSLAGIVALFGLARCAGGVRVGIIAAALMAALPVPVLEGVEARGYSMMMALATCSTWTLLSIRHDERAWKWTLYAALCALGAWAHLMTIFVPLGHGLWIAWRGVRGQRAFTGRGILALILAAVLTLTLYAPVLPDLWHLRSTFRGDAGAGPRMLGREGLGLLLQLGGSWAWWAAAPGLALLAWGARVAWRDERGRALLALGLLGLPVLVAAVGLAGTWVYARFGLFAVPGALAVIAVGIDALWTKRRRAGQAALLALLVTGGADLLTRPPKQPLREAAQWVQDRAPIGAPVVVIGLRHQVLDAYAGDLSLVYSLEHGADLESVLERAGADWVIVYYPRAVPRERRTLLESRGYERRVHLRGWADGGNGDVEVWGR